MEAVSASCAEVIAGADGKTYRVKGICTSIANTTYGNWYLNDGTGEVYIYGTLDANGGKQNFLSLNIEVGDEVELEGPKTTYSGNVVELVDVTVIKITKSLIKVVSPEATISKDGGELEVKVAYKGKGAYADIPADAQEWIRYKTTEFIAGVPSKIEQNPADTAVFKFDIMANVAGAREGKIAFNSGNGSGTSNVEYTFTQEGAIEEVTIADFLSREEGSAQYKISGIVTKIVNTTYGNIYIKDATGEAYIYGLLTSKGQSKQFETMGIEEGDVVTVVGTRSSYKGNPQMPSSAMLRTARTSTTCSPVRLRKSPKPVPRTTSRHTATSTSPTKAVRYTFTVLPPDGTESARSSARSVLAMVTKSPSSHTRTLTKVSLRL